MIKIYPIAKDADKKEFANSIALKLWGTTIERLPSGKPVLKGSDLNISISHTATLWAIMDCTSPCGIDIELTERRASHLASKFASQIELEVAKALFPENPSLLIWCAKEALYKYLSVEGVDFRRDLLIVSGSGSTLRASAFGKIITLNFYVQDNLLIVHTL